MPLVVGRLSGAHVALLVALFLMPGAGAAWTQAQGDAARNGDVALPGGVLDIVEVSRLWPVGEERTLYTFASAGGIATSAGLAHVSYGEGTCRLDITRPGGETRLLHEWGRCSFGHLTALDEETDRAFVCLNLPDVGMALAAVSARTGDALWTHTWFGAPCLGAAYDATNGRLYLPQTVVAADGPRARLDALDAATGEVVFVAHPSPVAGTRANVDLGFGVPQYGRGVTVTETGVLLTGYADPSRAAAYEDMFVAWFDMDGVPRGIERASLGEAPGSNGRFSRAGTQWPAARGALAALGLGDEVVVLQPQTGSVVLRAPLTAVEPTTQGVFWRSAVWGDRAIILQLPHSLRAFEPATLSPSWTWTESLDHVVHDVLRVSGGRILVLASSGNDTLLVDLDEATGLVLGRMSLPLPLEDGARAILAPAAGEALHVLGDDGTLLRLGRADDAARPSVTVSNAFPAPGERVHLTATSTAGEDAVLVVDWGDARPQPLGPDGASRVLSARGVRDVTVRAAFPDGTTASTVLTLDVGGTPPPKLTALQTAFAPENQDLTFGILGIALTLLGAIVTVGRTRARIARLERELDAMEEIRILSGRDPREAVRALRDYRAALPREMARRRIDESHYHVLEARSARLLRVLRARLFAPYLDRLSDGYRRLLEAAFEDATLGPAEWALLNEGLATEAGLTDGERRDVRELLGDFVAGAPP